MWQADRHCLEADAEAGTLARSARPQVQLCARPWAPCDPSLLAALGPVLCLHPAQASHALHGYHRSRRVTAWVHLDSDGLHESLWFFDAMNIPCWRLHVLPDTDFLAWERVLASVPVLSAPSATFSAGPRRGRCRCSQPWRWRACALRLYTLGPPAVPQRLVADEVTLSEIGRQRAVEIARTESVDWAGTLDE